MTTACLYWLQDDGQSDLASLASALNRAEQQEFASFPPGERQRNFVLSRTLLYRLVTTQTGCRTQDIRFIREESGRLALQHPAGWHVSLSHAKGLVAVMLAPQSCGIDIERSRQVNIQNVITRYFSETEKNTLSTYQSAERQQAFFRLWTLKEAGVKALQQGLAGNLSRLAFDVSAEEPRQLAGDCLQLWQQARGDIFLAAAVAGTTPAAWSAEEVHLDDLARWVRP